MGVQHPPIIAAGAFARHMPLKILGGQIPKRGFVQSILPHLRGILTLRDRAHLNRREFPCLIHGEWAIGPEREAAHPPPMRFSKMNDLRPRVIRNAKPRNSVSRTNTCPVRGNGDSSMSCFVNRGMQGLFRHPRVSKM
jgi:hypothetical protein